MSDKKIFYVQFVRVYNFRVEAASRKEAEERTTLAIADGLDAEDINYVRFPRRLKGSSILLLLGEEGHKT